MRFTKFRLAGAVTVIALVIPAAASAVFTDVPPGAFYADSVAWAADNGITTGKTPTQFAPEEAVTRGQLVTFLKRYNDNVVEPALGAATPGTIVMNHGTNNLVADSDDPPTSVEPRVNGTDISGDGVALTSISGPTAMGTTGYVLQSIEVCIGSVTIGGQLTRVEVWEGGPSSTRIANVALDARVQGCTTVPVNNDVDGGIGVAFHVGSDTFESVRIVGLTSTWTAAA